MAPDATGRGSVAFHAKAGGYSVNSTSSSSTPYSRAISAALITPVARARSYRLASSNMMSSVMSKGPAFLLLQALAISLSLAIQMVSSDVFVFNGERAQRVGDFHHVFHEEFEDLAALEVRRRKWKSHISFAAHAAGEIGMQQRHTCQ